jgi:ATP-binding cassette, subfamily B, bacterial
MGAEEPTLYLWRKTWEHSAGNRHKVVLYLVLSTIANLASFVQPLLVALLLNTVQTEGVSQQNLFKLLLLCSTFLILHMFFWLLHGPSRVLETKNSFLVRANYRKYLLEGVLALPPSWHAEHHSGDTIDKIEKGTNGLYRFSSNTFEIIETLIRLVSSVVILFYFNFSSGFIVLFFIVMAALVVLHYDVSLRKHLREINHAENSASQKAFDYISNISTVIILRMEKIAASDIMRKVMQPFNTFSEYTKTNELKWGLVATCSAAMTVGVLGAYLYHTVNAGGVVLVGTLYALYGYSDRISGLFYRFAGRYSDIVQQKTAVENAEELAKDFAAKKNKHHTELKDWKIIKIQHVTFSYDQGGVTKQDHLHLRDTTFTIRKGEKIALIGESGSGKTTFLKLLRGLYTPEQATILVDKKQIPSLESIEESVTLIPQDPELFTTTVRENIVMGSDCSDEELIQYTDLACFTSVAQRLPHKFESSIKEKGVNLSGGEKQRLALSRGLLACRGKEIILMDEPTSSVDAKNELAIYRNVLDHFNDKTIISTIHRLHLLPMFDTIYFFDKGRIIAHGSPAELMAKSPEFRALWKKYRSKQK